MWGSDRLLTGQPHAAPFSYDFKILLSSYTSIVYDQKQFAVLIYIMYEIYYDIS